jgi:hypothetical protein
MAAGFHDAQNYLEEFRKIGRELQLKEVDIESTLIQDFRPPDNSLILCCPSILSTIFTKRNAFIFMKIPRHAAYTPTSSGTCGG